MDNNTKRRLTTPCDLDWFNCDIYEENIAEKLKKQFSSKIRKDPQEIARRGCRRKAKGAEKWAKKRK